MANNTNLWCHKRGRHLLSQTNGPHDEMNHFESRSKGESSGSSTLVRQWSSWWCGQLADNSFDFLWWLEATWPGQVCQTLTNYLQLWFGHWPFWSVHEYVRLIYLQSLAHYRGHDLSLRWISVQNLAHAKFLTDKSIRATDHLRLVGLILLLNNWKKASTNHKGWRFVRGLLFSLGPQSCTIRNDRPSMCSWWYNC